VDALDACLRKRARPIIGRIDHARYLLHVRTLREKDYAYIAQAIAEAVK
jgi:L-seryl-tRNA(Ser) seleniumtransferase